MVESRDFEIVLSAYPAGCQPSRVEALGDAGGLSGAQFWRLATAAGSLCLRRWPSEHPDARQLAWIHRVLAHATSRGFTRLPLPLPTREGKTWVQAGDHLWQLEPWLSGKADWLTAPGPAKLQAAMTALAQFHNAVADFPLDEPQIAAAPGIQRRRRQVAWWADVGMNQLARVLDHQAATAGRGVALEIVNLFHRGRSQVESLLDQVQQLAVPLAPCIRDIWHDNVLFIGEQVSGMVDFGAMQTDSVAADIARLLGSLAGDDRAAWQTGMDSYQSVRRLNGGETRLVEAFDRANCLLSAPNWMRWLYLDGRQFDNLNRVHDRIQTQLARMKSL